MEIVALLITILISNYLVFKYTRETSLNIGYHRGARHCTNINEVMCKEVLEMDNQQMIEAYLKAQEIYIQRGNN